MRAGWIGSASAPSSSASRSAAAATVSCRLADPGRPVGPAHQARRPRRAGRRAPGVRSPDADSRRGRRAGDLAGGVGEVHDAGGRGAVLAAEDAVAEPEVEGSAGHDHEVGPAERRAARLGHQQRVAAGHDAAAHAVGDGRETGPLDQPQRGLLGAVGPHVGAQHEHRSWRLAEQLGDLGERVRVRLGALARYRRRARSTAAESKNSSIGTSTKTGPRCERAGQVNASSIPPATSARGVDGARRLVTGATIGGWSSSCRLPVPQRFCGARPPTTTSGDPLNWAWAIALTPLVTPGPAVSTARPGLPGQLAHRLGGEDGGLLVTHVEDPHRWVGVDRAVVHREDVGADRVNIDSTPWAAATATACWPAWASTGSDARGAGSARSGRWAARVPGSWTRRLARSRRPGTGVHAAGRANRAPRGVLRWAGAVADGARPSPHRPPTRGRRVARAAARGLADHRRPLLRRPGAVAAGPGRPRATGPAPRCAPPPGRRPSWTTSSAPSSRPGAARCSTRHCATGGSRARATRSGVTTYRCGSRRSRCAGATG